MPLHLPLLPAGLSTALCLSLVPPPAAAGGPPTRPQDEQRLSFQTYEPYRPSVNLNADVAMVYGIDQSLPDRLKTWADHGYLPQVMTGVAWGEYKDYVYGQWDGTSHLDEAQTQSNGDKIGHGKDVYYMSPGIKYGQYLSEGVGRAIDAGATAIYLEEPEFWVRAGYSEGFKREWQDYYHEPWQDPVSSPEAQYRASKLKYYLYKRALSQVFDFVRDYGRKVGRDIKCYVPTHSMINYASWGIVSPESSLLEVGADGFIAQVWTGTARTPNVYEGRKEQRTFETAFLEYGSMQNLVRASGRRVWYLNDPIEDNPRHSWYDYRTNWESTLTASLLQPEVWHFEIMPWPHRIFEKKYPSTQPVRPETPRVAIPAEYETELQAVITAMGDLKQPADKVQWAAAGTQGTGVLVADTMMFQRFGPDASDGDLGSFYGLALPLLMRGVPVEPVQIETAQLGRYNTLLLTYEGQKPPTPAFHDALAKWVNGGGSLVVVDDDKDPFNAVREWWNTGDNHYKTPRAHLFETLGLDPDAAGTFAVGKGKVVFAKASPAALSHDAAGADRVRELVKAAMDGTQTEWTTSDALVLRRGPYVVAAGLGDGNFAELHDRLPFRLTGRLIPLFDAGLPVVAEHTVTNGSRALLVDLDRVDKKVGVAAAACRARNEVVTDAAVTFEADGLEGSNAVVCLKLPAAPKGVSVDGTALAADAYDFADGVLRVRFTNHAEPVRVVVER